jgi:hypothetical protein
MVLTDDHLNDLERYVRQRLALHRYVEGWGVVAGLSLHLDSDHPGSVLVSPGYARSCCGDDVVVCEDITVDVCTCESGAPCCTHGKTVTTKDKDENPSGAADVYLVPSQTAVDPVAVGGCSCGGHDELVHERVIDGGALWCVPVVEGTKDPIATAYASWEKGFTSSTGVFDDLVDSGVRGDDDKAVRKWLLKWIKRRQDPSLRLLQSWLAEKSWPDTSEPEGRAPLRIQALVEVVSALRLSYLERTFAACDSAQGKGGILLGRVSTTRESNTCRVSCIDAQPPYRRVLTPPGWPYLSGEVNLGPLIWQRWAVAQERAWERDVSMRDPQPLPWDVGELAGVMKNTPIAVPRGSALTAYLYVDHCAPPGTETDQGRVVAWRAVGDETDGQS